MARTITEIYDALVAEKQARPELDDLTSTSAVAIWRLWLYVVATALHVHERIFDQHIVEVEQIAARSIVGKLEWYAFEARKFQFGYAIVFDNQTYRYFYIDSTSPAAEAARIIDRVSCKEVFGASFSGIRIKVAKEQGGSLVKLTPEELEAFTYYISRISFAGVAIDVISLDADLLSYNIRVYYDGVLPASDVLTAVEQAVNGYLSAIEFDGILLRNKLIDSLQALAAVRDVEIVRIASKPALGSNWVDIGRRHEPLSGYYEAMQLGPGVNDSKIELIAE